MGEVDILGRKLVDELSIGQQNELSKVYRYHIPVVIFELLR